MTVPSYLDFPEESQKTQIKPPAIILMGAVGTGKTYSLASWVKAGLSLRVLFTDPGGEESLVDALLDQKLPLDNVHWKYIAPASVDWDTMKNTASIVTTMNYESLAKVKEGVNKGKYRQFYQILACLSEFVCDRTGENLGPVDSWGNDCVFALDSMSGLNQIAKDLVVGAKPAPHQGEWGMMMDVEERLINKIASDCKCFVTVTTHFDTYRDELTGVPKYMPAMLGNKLAPRLPRMFSDVVLAKRVEDQFVWSTLENNYDLKARNFPISSKILPDFQQAVRKYKARLNAVNVAKPEPAKETQPNPTETETIQQGAVQ